VTARLRVLHVSPSYGAATVYGGPAISVPALCESLAQSGVDVTVLTTTANGAGELDVPVGTPRVVDGVKVTYFRRWTGDHTHLSPALVRALASRVQSFDAVHVHSWWNLVAVAAVAACALQGTRPLVSPRGMLSPFSFRRGTRARRVFHALVGRPLLECGLLHATSGSEAADCALMCPGAEVTTLPNFVRMPARPSVRPPVVPGSPLRLAILARVHPVKGIDLALDALAALAAPWSLEVIGGGDAAYVAELQARARRLGIADRVHWRGEVVGDARFEALARVDVLLVTSVSESFSNVVVEALSVGTPAIVTPGVGLAEYVAESELGWVAPRDVTGLARVVEAARADLGRRAMVAARGPELAREHFFSPALAQRYVELYRRLS